MSRALLRPSGHVAIGPEQLSMLGDSGAFALTGQAASLKKGYALAAGTGAFVETGVAALFPRNYQMAANVGAFSLNGKAATLAYSGAGGGDTLVWSTAWVNGLGSGATALNDGTKFNNNDGNFTMMEVVSAAGAGLPSGIANALHMHWDGVDTHYHQLHANATQLNQVPAVGQYAYYRWFMAQVGTGSQDLGQAHPIHFGESVIYFTFNGFSISGGKVDIHFLIHEPTVPNYPYNSAYYGNNGGAGPLMNANQFYCFEMRVLRVSTTVVNIDFRVSNADGSGMTDTSAWHQDGVAWTGQVSAVTWANGGFQQLVFGPNDPRHPGVCDTYIAAWAYKISSSANSWFGVSQAVGEVWS